MKIALVHDHLVQDGGAEKVLAVLQELYPEAPTFTLLYDRQRANPVFLRRDIRTSFLQKMPFSLKRYQWYLPLMPVATESYDLTEYDVVLSSSSAFAKGVLTRTDAAHICYCHSPTRYLWTDTHSYIRELGYPGPVKKMLPLMLSKLRQWDRLAADRVDSFIANSATVQQRIEKFYRAKSEVIYPPVDLTLFSQKSKPGGEYFLAGGRLVPYKRFDLIIRAFNRLGIPLKIFGDGPERKRLQALARPHIELLGYVSDEERGKLYRGAAAFVNPQIEDFGITIIEAMASGTPVLAYAAGGALETVKEGETGLFFHEQRWEELADLVIRFQADRFDPRHLHEHAQTFQTSEFKRQINAFVERSLEQKRKAMLK